MSYEHTGSNYEQLCFIEDITTKGNYDFVFAIPKRNNTGAQEQDNSIKSIVNCRRNPNGWGKYNKKESRYVTCIIPAYGFSLIIIAMEKVNSVNNHKLQSYSTSGKVNNSSGKLYEVKNVQEYIDIIDKLNSENITRDSLFYRGHSKIKYEPMPSIYRGDEDNESKLFRDFLIENYSACNDTSTTLDLLAKMQHYSLSTRLLDISSNPLVALWFATEPKEGDDDEKLTDGDSDNDGAVCLFNVKSEKLKYYDADAVVCLSNLAKLTSSEKNNLTEQINKYFFDLMLPVLKRKLNASDLNAVDLFKNTHDFIMDVIAKSNLETDATSKYNLIKDFNKDICYFLDYIKKDKPSFSSGINPIDLTSAFFVRVIKSNPRLKSQFGAFIIMGLNKLAMNNVSHDLVSIKEEHKIHIRKQLDYLGINEQSLYLELDNSAKYLKSTTMRVGGE